MSKPLLITTGCSWTADDYAGYIDNNIRTWPHVVSNFMDWELMNVASAGRGNDFISDAAIDAISKNEDRDIIVFAYWTQSNRLNIFDSTFVVFTPGYKPDRHKDDKFIIARDDIKNSLVDLFNLVDDDDQESVVMNVINRSLRSVYILDDFCKKRNIKILHNIALPIIPSAHWVLDKEKKLKIENVKRTMYYEKKARELFYYKKVDKIKNKVVNSMFDKMESGFERHCSYLIRGDNHPNQKGHQLIAFDFITKYEELFTKKFEGPEPVFVYD